MTFTDQQDSVNRLYKLSQLPEPSKEETDRLQLQEMHAKMREAKVRESAQGPRIV